MDKNTAFEILLGVRITNFNEIVKTQEVMWSRYGVE